MSEIRIKDIAKKQYGLVTALAKKLGITRNTVYSRMDLYDQGLEVDEVTRKKFDEIVKRYQEKQQTEAALKNLPKFASRFREEFQTRWNGRDV